MIKIRLPNNYQVDDIYNELASKVYDSMKKEVKNFKIENSKISEMMIEISKTVNSENEDNIFKISVDKDEEAKAIKVIKKFLLAKDFFNYKIKIYDGVNELDDIENNETDKKYEERKLLITLKSYSNNKSYKNIIEELEKLIKVIEEIISKKGKGNVIEKKGIEKAIEEKKCKSFFKENLTFYENMGVYLKKIEELIEKLSEFITKYSFYSDDQKKTKKTVINNSGENFLDFVASEYSGHLNYFKKYDFISKCFNYHKLNTYRHELINKMNVTVCPYCNMNYIVNYKDEDDILKTTADLDHFYVKSEYPLFALCLYNFIPSCPVCNSRMKGSKSMNMENNIYPYNDDFEGKAKFEISNMIEYLVGDEELELKLDIYNDDNNRVENNEKIFKINKLYESQKNIAEELIRKSRTYNSSYQERLEKLFPEDEIKSMIFGEKLNSESIANHSLGKLKMDLLKQLKIY